jgi:hypothetical protein
MRFIFGDSELNYFEVVIKMDLSQMKWVKNVKPAQGWAYDKISEMPIPEAKIFRLHWRDDKDNAQKPLKGDLIALVQSAKVTHVVELLDDVVYENSEKEWGIYRIVRAIWMPPKTFDWVNLPHQRDIFGVEHLPPNGNAHDLSKNQVSQHWQDLGGLQGFQKHLGDILSQI